MSNLIDGKVIAKEYQEKIREFVLDQKVKGKRPPCLATILVGDDGGSYHYVKNQDNLCSDLGIQSRKLKFDNDIDEEQLVNEIEKLNKDNSVDGIIIQLPLPKNIDKNIILSKINSNKDIDCLTDTNMGKLYKDDNAFVPCTAKGIVYLIENTGCKLEGKNVVVIGRSNIVGKPVANLLLSRNCTVTICHSKTIDLKTICKRADIIIVAIGKPGFITADFVNNESIIIDVGTTVVNGKLQGDVNFEDVSKLCAYISPVPGGVGAMTTTMLLKNVCEAYERNVY